MRAPDRSPGPTGGPNPPTPTPPAPTSLSGRSPWRPGRSTTCPACGLDAADLIAHRDGELASPQAATITTRIATCPACTRRLHDLAATAALLRAAPAPVPADPTAQLATRWRIAAGGARPGGAPGRSWRPALTRALAPLVILLAVIVFDPLSSWTPTPPPTACVGCDESDALPDRAAPNRAARLTLPARDAAALTTTLTLHDPRTGSTAIVTRERRPIPGTTLIATRDTVERPAAPVLGRPALTPGCAAPGWPGCAPSPFAAANPLARTTLTIVRR